VRSKPPPSINPGVSPPAHAGRKIDHNGIGYVRSSKAGDAGMMAQDLLPMDHAGRFPQFDVTAKLLVSLGIGLLVGFEREWAHKDLGVRTFALISLLGMLAALQSQPFAWIGLGAVVILIAVMNAGNLLLRRDLEMTTCVALIVTYTLGAMVGAGHVFTPTASAILMTLLLALKPQLSRFAGGVTSEEIRGAVLLGLLGFVIYPLLPNRDVDPWGLFNPREVWLTVILIAGLGFVNYVLLRLFSARGLYYTAVFGGLVNSTATVAELVTALAGSPPENQTILTTLTLTTVLAMFVRNLVLMAVFSPLAAWKAVWPIAAMCVFTALAALRERSRDGARFELPSRITSPISIGKIVRFGSLFLAIEIFGGLSLRWLGEAGSVAVSFIGGLVSSASATAAAGSLAAHGELPARTAAICVVLSSIASALVNLPVIYRMTRNSGIFRRLIVLAGATAVIGLGALMLTQ
jgi:uncharacterized membrane protein (DUF4010 family)